MACRARTMSWLSTWVVLLVINLSRPQGASRGILAAAQSDEAAFLMSYTHPEGPMIKRPAPPEAFAQSTYEWKKYVREGQQEVEQGNLHKALQSYMTLWQSSFLYAQMMDQDRYQVHLELSRLLVRMGLLPRAEAILFEATSLVSEPHEAYRELGRLKAQQGLLAEAMMHYKHLLFFLPEDLDALQRLGSLLIIAGDINQGRHYLIRAVTVWERDVRHMLASMQYTAKFGQTHFYHWLCDYLLSSLASDSGDKERIDKEVSRFSLLSHLVKQVEPLSPRAHFELGTTLWDMGLYEEGRLHLHYSRAVAPPPASPPQAAAETPLALASSNTGLTQSLASLRLALDVVDPLLPGPVPQSFFDQVANLDQSEKPFPIPPHDLFEAFAPLPLLLASLTRYSHSASTPHTCPHASEAGANSTGPIAGCAGVAEAYPVWTLLQHYCPALAPSPPPPPPPVVPGRYSVAVVSSLLGHSQSLAMTTSAMVQGLRTQPGLTLTLYYFPGPPLPSSLTSLFHVVQPLPFSWAPPPDRQLHDLLLLPDVPDAATYFLLCQHPLAHTQATFLSDGGTSLGLPCVDYHLLPSALAQHDTHPHATHYTEQVCPLGGGSSLSYLHPLLLSLSAQLPPPPHPSTFGPFTFFHHQHLLLLPLPPSPPPLSTFLASLLLSLPSCEILLLPPSSSPPLLFQRYHHQLTAALPPTLARRVRLMPSLPLSERLSLMRISTALLDPPVTPPVTPLLPLLEALVASCPILTLQHSRAASLMRALGLPSELTTTSSVEEYIAIAAQLASTNNTDDQLNVANNATMDIATATSLSSRVAKAGKEMLRILRDSKAESTAGEEVVRWLETNRRGQGSKQQREATRGRQGIASLLWG